MRAALVADLLFRLREAMNDAAAEFAEALMDGCGESYRVGLTREDAVRSACDVFRDADRETVESILSERGR